jgi:hypothetical protein
MIEMGSLISSKEFLSKTKVFVLKDASITQMLSPFFTQGKNLFYFQDVDELKSIILGIYSDF